MLGLDQAYLKAWKRAYDSHRRAGDLAGAAPSAWSIGDSLRFPETVRGPPGGTRWAWLLDRLRGDCVARGYLLCRPFTIMGARRP